MNLFISHRGNINGKLSEENSQLEEPLYKPIETKTE